MYLLKHVSQTIALHMKPIIITVIDIDRGAGRVSDLIDFCLHLFRDTRHYLAQPTRYRLIFRTIFTRQAILYSDTPNMFGYIWILNFATLLEYIYSPSFS